MKQLKKHRSMADQDRHLLTRCRTAIKSIEPSAEVILYGSRARGDAKEESDYDFLILTDEEVTLEREDVFRRQLYPLEMKTGAVLTVILVSRGDWGSVLYHAMPFYQNVERDGVIL